MHGLAVITIEGIGSVKTKLHPVQERIAKAHGSQCGFCTPGIIMSMYALLRTTPKPSMKDLEIAFQGKLGSLLHPYIYYNAYTICLYNMLIQYFEYNFLFLRYCVLVPIVCYMYNRVNKIQKNS